MSILVKGMAMPTDCRECPLQEYHERTGKTWCKPVDRILAENYKPIPFDGIPDWCPLAEVKTPHGRLIDENEIRWADYIVDGEVRGYKIAFSDEMPDAVIDAEGEG